MNALRSTLKQDAFWKLNKVFVYVLGIEEAVILTMMLDKFYYYQDRKQTVIKENKEWFYYTSETIKKYFGLSYKVQKTVLKNLETKGYIFQKAFGVPCRLHFSLDENKIYHLLNTSIDETEIPVLPKGENWNLPNGETINKNINNNNQITKSLSNDKDKNVSDDLFSSAGVDTPKKEKKKKSSAKKDEKPELLLRDAPESDLQFVKDHIGEKWQMADLEYYHEAALAWSDKDQNKAKDWLATIRGFILRDKRDGKLVVANANDEPRIGTIQQVQETWDQI